MSSGQSGVLLYTLDGTGIAQLWTFMGSTWGRLLASPPPGRYGPAMAYDPNRRLAYLFGGDWGNGNKTNELWTYDGASWLAQPLARPQSLAVGGVMSPWPLVSAAGWLSCWIAFCFTGPSAKGQPVG